MADQSEWPGLMLSTDPHDLPPGAAVEQDNFVSADDGILQVRGGMTAIQKVVSGEDQYTNIWGLESYRKDEEETYFVQAGSKVWWSENGGTQIESGVSTTYPSCWAQSRAGSMIRINGKPYGTPNVGTRGTIFYEGATPYDLGIIAPTVAPNITPASGGDCTPGTYGFAYRWLDANGVASNISPITWADADATNKRFSWTAYGSSENRVETIQFFRTLSDDARVLYLVNESNVAGFTDEESDDTIRTYFRLPILNPDGTLCARRFVPPPYDMSVVVAYQDRFFYTCPPIITAENRNKIYYSEIDEPESVPITQNVITVQENTKARDYITGLMPMGNSLFILQKRHTYKMTFVRQPIIDAGISLVCERGCVNQRCWDTLDSDVYLLDQCGCWTLSGGGGAMQDISADINEYFTKGWIDWTNSKWYFVIADQVRKEVRFFFLRSENHPDGADDITPYARPYRCFVYNAEKKRWWTESYSDSFTCGFRFEIDGRLRTMLGGTNNLYVTDQGTADNGSSITATYRSGYQPIPEYVNNQPDEGSRAVRLVFEPTTNTQTINVNLFFDYDSIAQKATSTYMGENVQRTAGNANFGIAMKKAISTLGSSPGYATIPFRVRAESNTMTRRFMSIEMTAVQNAEALKIYTMEIVRMP